MTYARGLVNFDIRIKRDR